MMGPGIESDRFGAMNVFRKKEVSLESIAHAIEARGRTLKTSPKSTTLHVNSWIVKGSRRDSYRAILKHCVQPGRYRQGWIAALHLERAGVQIPTPQAYVEFRSHGFRTGNVMIMDYLQDQVNVERFASAMVERKAADEEISAYLAALAEAVNGLSKAGAYHADLSGKNIYTKDGSDFHFIDLDGVVLNRRYTDKLRMKNHTQLYDSFCDFWGDEHLLPFLAQMLPEGHDYRVWAKAVRRSQASRRRRQMDLWKRQGRSW